MPSYDPNNIFAKILRGELPSYKVYEDDKAIAFLDIMPRSPGHTLVLPKAPARNILDIGADDLAHVMMTTQKIAKAAIKAFSADGITIQQFNEGAGGQVVFHLHVRPLGLRLGLGDDRSAWSALLVPALAIVVGHIGGSRTTDRNISLCKGESHGRSIAFGLHLGHAVT